MSDYMPKQLQVEVADLYRVVATRENHTALQSIQDEYVPYPDRFDLQAAEMYGMYEGIFYIGSARAKDAQYEYVFKPEDRQQTLRRSGAHGVETVEFGVSDDGIALATWEPSPQLAQQLVISGPMYKNVRLSEIRFADGLHELNVALAAGMQALVAARIERVTTGFTEAIQKPKTNRAKSIGRGMLYAFAGLPLPKKR